MRLLNTKRCENETDNVGSSRGGMEPIPVNSFRARGNEKQIGGNEEYMDLMLYGDVRVYYDYTIHIR